jgi:hypothetical protein
MAKKKKRLLREAVPTRAKPTILVDSRKVGGNSLKVGKRVQLNLSGKVMTESIDDWEAPGRKSWRVEINRVGVPTKRRKRGGKGR